MQENSFEMGVRQKMEDLSFVPAEPVWQKVEAQLGAKKRRRRLAFLLLPMLLLGGGLAYYFASDKVVADNGMAKVPNENNVIVNKNTPENLNTLIDSTESNSVAAKRLEQSTETAISANQKSEKLTLNQKEKEAFATAAYNNKKQIAKSKQSVFNKETAAENLLGNDLHALVLENEIAVKEGRKKMDESISNPFQQKEDETNKLAQKAELKQQKTASFKAETDSLQHAVAAMGAKAADSLSNALAPGPKGKSSVWRWSVNARVGISGVRSSVGDVFSPALSADFYASPPTGSVTLPAPTQSAALSNHVAYAAGAGVRRQLGNVQLSIGLQYSQYATQSNVGESMAADTAVRYNNGMVQVDRFYNRTGAATTYTTRYHYLELPPALEYQPVKAWPLHLQHGFSVGRLLHTNALYFDRGAQLFYSNDDWLRKTSFNIFTTIDYTLFKTAALSLLAGPHLQWSLTPLQQKWEPKKHHLFAAGLNMRIVF